MDHAHHKGRMKTDGGSQEEEITILTVESTGSGRLVPGTQRTQATPGAVGDFPLYGQPASLFSGSLAQTMTGRLEPREPDASSSSATEGTATSVTAKVFTFLEQQRGRSQMLRRGHRCAALTTPEHI